MDAGSQCCAPPGRAGGYGYFANPAYPEFAEVVSSRRLPGPRSPVGRVGNPASNHRRVFNPAYGYFKAMHMVMGGKVEEGNDAAYVPIRRFDDNVFVLPSGRSLIGQLMVVADRIVIEDGDLRTPHLRGHIEEFGLSTLRVRDMSDRQRMRGASLTLVDKRS